MCWINTRKPTFASEQNEEEEVGGGISGPEKSFMQSKQKELGLNEIQNGWADESWRANTHTHLAMTMEHN